ncbi:hypothetical protein BC830DRAFT_1071941 [Chytriomyces sp. MP71]|nr:hypothetical protein BC830DRAFT_1071941 [Chytriomyces sp. MP71]
MALIDPDPANGLRGPVTASMSFYAGTNDGQPPYAYIGINRTPPTGQPRNNTLSESKVVTVTDMRGIESRFTLDTFGFQCVADNRISEDLWRVLSDAAFDWNDEAVIGKRLHGPVEALLKKEVEGARHVAVFSCIKRSSDKNDQPKASAPATLVHVDQTPAMGFERIDLLPLELQHSVRDGSMRCRIINVWIPLVEHVFDYPLALGDSRSCREEDLVSVKTFLKARDGENSRVRYSKDMDFYYWSGMTRREALLVKCFDTRLENDATGSRSRTPHGSFKDPRIPSDNTTPVRKSVEARCLVIG